MKYKKKIRQMKPKSMILQLENDLQKFFQHENIYCSSDSKYEVTSTITNHWAIKMPSYTWIFLKII